jgi:nucleotide-binding universal stress UspA family protein
MIFTKKILVAVDLNMDSSELFNTLREMDFIKHAEVHFVHVFNSFNYSFMFGDFPLVYPIEADRKVIKDGVLRMLDEKVKGFLPKDFDGKLINQCLFSDDPKAKFCEYIKEISPELVIIGTRLKHGIFESSFAHYVSRHSNANLLLLKKGI